MSFLQLVNLTKRYGDAVAVDAIDLSIDKGMLVCLLGPSGCGKTTTLRLIAGFVQPDGGEIRVGGKTISSPAASEPPERRNMSMIFQSYALWPHLTVFENIAYGLRLRRQSNQEISDSVGAILSATKLDSLAERYPSELSGGQQQRVSLARALVIKPEILLLDEPLSNLDTNLREEMRFEIRSLHNKYRYTTVYVTHDQSEAMTAADLIVVMNQGRIEQIGTPETIYQEPVSEFVARFIGGTNLFKGKSLGNGLVQCAGGLVLKCGSGSAAAQGDTFVSARFHTIALHTQKTADTSENWAQGTVVRQVFLGTHRDYIVSIAGGEQVRINADAGIRLAEGESIWLHFPPAHCRALPN